LYALTAFNSKWDIVKDLSEEDDLIAQQVSNFKKFSMVPTDVYARQIARIMSKPIHTSFIEAMLFSSTALEDIAMHSDLPLKIIELYKTLFFDTDEFMGKLDKVEFFQSLINSNKPGDGEHTRGMLLKSAFSYGWKYVAIKFHMDESQDFGTPLMELMARSAFYKWNDDNLEGQNSKSYYRDTKEVLSIMDATIKAQDGANDEKKMELMEEMMSMNEEFAEAPKEMIVKFFDVTRGRHVDPSTIIDVVAIEE